MTPIAGYNPYQDQRAYGFYAAGRGSYGAQAMGNGSYGAQAAGNASYGTQAAGSSVPENSKLAEQDPKVKAEHEAEDDRLKKMGLRPKYDTHEPSCECETCKKRKYQDGSNEMVSFKTPQTMTPTEAATRVRAHEQEHVANAFAKAEQKNGKVLQASVRIFTKICPECGRTYVSGGLTTTQIKYYNEDNPYQKDLKAQHHDAYTGRNVDYAV